MKNEENKRWKPNTNNLERLNILKEENKKNDALKGLI